MNPSNTQNVKPLYKATQLVWYILGALETLLIFRFVLKLLGANPNAGFSDLVYTLSSVFSSPFASVFRVTDVEGNVFEWTTLLAMVVYLLLAYALVNLLFISRPVSNTEASIGLQNQD